jgi:hypothetical protein
MAYSKAKLKSNGDRASPKMEPFQYLICMEINFYQLVRGILWQWKIFMKGKCNYLKVITCPY